MLASANECVTFCHLHSFVKPILFPELPCEYQRSLRYSLRHGKSVWRNVHERAVFRDIVAWNRCAESTFLCRILEHHCHTMQNAVLRVYVIVVHVHKHIIHSLLNRQVSLCCDRHSLVALYIGNVRDADERVLNRIVAVVKNHPLQLIFGVSLEKVAILCKSHERTAVLGHSDNGNVGQVLFLRERVL